MTHESGLAKQFILQIGSPKLRYLPAGSLLFHLIQLLQGPSLKPEEGLMTSSRHHRDPHETLLLERRNIRELFRRVACFYLGISLAWKALMNVHFWAVAVSTAGTNKTINVLYLLPNYSHLTCPNFKGNFWNILFKLLSLFEQLHAFLWMANTLRTTSLTTDPSCNFFAFEANTVLYQLHSVLYHSFLTKFSFTISASPKVRFCRLRRLSS